MATLCLTFWGTSMVVVTFNVHVNAFQLQHSFTNTWYCVFTQ
jgi:hypothetical protein